MSLHLRLLFRYWCCLYTICCIHLFPVFGPVSLHSVIWKISGIKTKFYAESVSWVLPSTWDSSTWLAQSWGLRNAQRRCEISCTHHRWKQSFFHTCESRWTTVTVAESAVCADHPLQISKRDPHHCWSKQTMVCSPFWMYRNCFQARDWSVYAQRISKHKNHSGFNKRRFPE